jgi:uncharacterized integral membrane protein (TIGR00698 family)
MQNGDPTFLDYLPGLGVASLIAVASVLLAEGHVALDPLVLSILVSIIAGNLMGPAPRLAPGISLSHRVLIPIGIILYGSQMVLQPLRALGTGKILYVLFLVFASLTVISVIGRRFSIPKKIGMLLAAGSSICGASAIVVLSPVIKAEKEDTSVALLAITIVGLTGVIVYPLLQEAFSLPDHIYAMLCGSTLFQMGQVKAAASLISQDALELAVPVKLMRVATLFPIAIAYSLIGRSNGRKLYVPWFIIGSIVLASLVNFVPELGELRSAAGPYVTLFFCTAIAGIGLSVDLEAIINVGPRPLLVVYLGWVVLVLLFLLGMVLLR